MTRRKRLAALLLASVAMLGFSGCHRHHHDHNHPPPPPMNDNGH